MEIKARIPGTIVAINVKPGDTVKARDNLGTMEAMKMEQPIPCPKDGVVKDWSPSATRSSPAPCCCPSSDRPAPLLRKRTPSQIYQKGCQERLWAASGVGDSNGRDF